MTKHTSLGLLLSVLSAIAFADQFTWERYETLHAELQHGDEPWRSIPWKIDLLDAQRSAADEKKPIFIWAMDGHPLGCT